MRDSKIRRKIFILASTLVTGGAEIIVKALAKGLPEELYEVEIICLHEPGSIGEQIAAEGRRIIHGLASGRFDPAAFSRLGSVLRDGGEGLLLSLDHRNAMIMGALASRTAKIRGRILASHSTGLWGKRGSFGRLDKMAIRLYDRVVALSRKHSDYLAEVEGLDRSKLAVIHNGVDIERFRPPGSAEERLSCRKALSIPENALVVTIVAALRPEKNHPMFIEAASAVSRSIDDIYFLIVGEGEERARLEKMALEYSVGDRMIFLGNRSDIPDILKGTDISVLCSYPVVETFPLTVLEAMASGVPVISTDVGSVSEIIRDGREGVLIEPEDSGRLAGAIGRLAADPGRRVEMGREGRMRVKENFSAGKMIEDYVGLFDSFFK